MSDALIDDVLRRFRSKDKSERESAAKELRAAARAGTLSISSAERLILAARESFPSDQNEPFPISCQLLVAAREISKDGNADRLLSALQTVFGVLTPDGRRLALQIVCQMQDLAAVRFYVNCLREHGGTLGHGIPEFSPAAGVEVARVLLPALLSLARDPAVAWPVFHTLLEFRNEGLAEADLLEPHEYSIAEVLGTEVERVLATQQATGIGWRYASPYLMHREMVGLLFDLAGAYDAPRLREVVRASDGLSDPRLRRFRAVALLRHNETAMAMELEWIARNPADRYWLFGQLCQFGLAEHLPESCHDQTLLAEGHLSDWLCYPTELGREPDEIELIHVESRPASQTRTPINWLRKRKLVDYFFFKYRVTEEHWSKKNGWMVGMAGGYQRDKQPTVAHDGGTFSRFTKHESKSIAEHVAEYLE